MARIVDTHPDEILCDRYVALVFTRYEIVLVAQQLNDRGAVLRRERTHDLEPLEPQIGNERLPALTAIHQLAYADYTRKPAEEFQHPKAAQSHLLRTISQRPAAIHSCQQHQPVD